MRRSGAEILRGNVIIAETGLTTAHRIVTVDPGVSGTPRDARRSLAHSYYP